MTDCYTRREVLEKSLGAILAYCSLNMCNADEPVYNGIPESQNNNPWTNSNAMNLKQFHRLSLTQGSGVTIYGDRNIDDPNKRIAVKFGAKWCPACMIFEKAIPEAIAKREDLTIVSIDCDKQPLISEYYIGQGTPIPSVVYLDRNGHILEDGTGKKILRIGHTIEQVISEIPIIRRFKR